MTDTMAPEVYKPTAHDYAQGLRQLAKFVEQHPDLNNGLPPTLCLGISFFDGVGEIELATIVEAADEMVNGGHHSFNGAVKFGDLVVGICGPPELFGSSPNDDTPRRYDRAEIIARGRAAEADVADGPF